MVIFEQGYQFIRNQYVKDIADYKIDKRSITKNGIKNLLISDKIKTVTKDSDTFYFYANRDDILKALEADILKFHAKAQLQYSDWSFVEKDYLISANWNTVTGYYSAFSDASLLLRLFHEGNIFFDKDYKRLINEIIFNLTGSVDAGVSSNSFFTIDLEDESILLRKADGNVHENVWKETYKILDQMLLNARDKSDEQMVLFACVSLNQAMTDTFPSMIRNKVNYQPEYVIKYLLDEYKKQPRPLEYYRTLLSFDKKTFQNDINSAIKYYLAYISYIHELTNKLMEYFFEIQDREDFIGKAVKKKTSSANVE